MGMVNKCECKGCESRYVGCHGECPSYIAFSKERNEILNMKHDKITEQSEIDAYKLEGCAKLVRNNRNAVRTGVLKGKR